MGRPGDSTRPSSETSCVTRGPLLKRVVGIHGSLRPCVILWAPGHALSYRQVGVKVGDHPLEMAARERPNDAVRVTCCEAGHIVSLVPHPELTW